MIYHWYLYGDENGVPLSMNAIARKLTEMHIRTRWDTCTGKNGEKGLPRRKHNTGVWSDFAVHTILTSETYIGRWAYRKTIRVSIPGNEKTKMVKTPKQDWLWVDIPPIITDRELYDAVQERMKHNTIMAARNNTFNYLFRGMFRCGSCGLAYCGCGPPRYRPRYRCSGHRKNQYIQHCDMPAFFEDELEAVIWPWIAEIVSNPDKIDEALAAVNDQASQQNGHILALLKTVNTLIDEYKMEQAWVMELYKRGSLDADRWEVEDRQCQQKIQEQTAQKQALDAKLVHTYYSPEYIRDIKAACAKISEGMNHFTREEKRETFDLLDLRGKFAVEEGYKVIYAECILDARRLVIKANEGGGGIANKSSSRLWERWRPSFSRSATDRTSSICSMRWAWPRRWDWASR
jgi:Recombinase/Recombinase zinc beta ribbon domain